MMPPNYFFDYRKLLSEARLRMGQYSSPTNLKEVHELETSGEYSLPHTLLSSYACYFFSPQTRESRFDPYHWTGINKPFEGLHILQTSEYEVQIASHVEFDQELLAFVRDSLGLWRQSFETPFSNLPLAEEYPGVRVPKLHKSMIDVLIAVLCSGHTTVTNGRRWFIFLQTMYPDYCSLKGADPYEVMRRSKEETGASMGYRARYVINTISDLAQSCSPKTELERIVEGNDPDEVRRKLLSIKSIGPKTVDCFLLNALGDTSVPPVDVNVQRVCSRLNLLSPHIDLPQSTLCKAFLCSGGSRGCPRFKETEELMRNGAPNGGGCLRAALKQKWTNAGWVQSMLFLHGIEYCRAPTPICHECKLKENCNAAEMRSIPVVRVRRRLIVHSLRAESPSFPEIVQLYPERIEALKQEMAELGAMFHRAKGMSRKLVHGMALWIAARKEGIPMSSREVEAFLGLKSGILFKRIQDASSTVSIGVPRLDLAQCVEAYARKFQLTEEEKKLALSFSQRAFRPGMSMIPLVGVSIQRSLETKGRRLNTAEVVEATRVTSVTIRKYRGILESSVGRLEP